MKLMVGVKALIVNDGRVLIIREASYEEGTNLGKWDVPGGRINTKEFLDEALRREVWEEVGLEVIPGSVLYVQENFPTIQGEECHVVRIHYLTTLTKDAQVVLSRDHDAYAWVTAEDLSGREYVEGLAEGISNYFANGVQ